MVPEVQRQKFEQGGTSPRLFLIINAFALVGVLFVNWLANALPIGGLNTGEVSARYANLFVPAGWAFSIWGVIYILLLLWIILTATNIKSLYKKIPFRNVSVLFWTSCLANAAWIFSWHALLPGIALIFMIILLVCLVIIFEQLAPSKALLPLWAYLPFELYLAWICVATIANGAAWLISLDWAGGGLLSESVWAAIMIAGGTAIGLFFIIYKRSVTFGLVLIWAFLAIFARRQADTGADDSAVEFTALVAAGLIALTLIGRMIGLLKSSGQ